MITLIEPSQIKYQVDEKDRENSAKYTTPNKKDYQKQLESKKQQLIQYAENWESLPQAYELIVDNENLLQALSKEEAIDLYARLDLYSKVTHGRKNLSEKAVQELVELMSKTHYALKENPEQAKQELEREAQYTTPSLFKTGAYHDRFKRLGSRFESRLEQTVKPQKRIPRGIYLHKENDLEKRVEPIKSSTH